ncbi:MAG: hypothetical protein IPN26_03570 [Bacteroidetes bacterium]|nr:hypothetical protein [Bacteroidota bacterium]
MALCETRTKAGITNGEFKNCNRSIAIFENNAITNCSITGNTFTADGNMLAPYANLKPEHGIYVYNSASLQIGDIGAPNDGNVFENLQNGIKIFNETVMITIGQGPNQQIQLIPAPSSYIQLKNNTMSGITRNNGSSVPEAGVGVYAEANSLFGGRPRLLITNSTSPSALTAPTFQNCEQAVSLIQASANVFNQHIDHCGIGIGAIKCDGEKYNISSNYLNQTYWNIVKTGDESTLGFFVNNNTISMPEDEPTLIGLPPIGILSAYSSKIHQGHSQINTNGIRISEGQAGIGISLNNGKDDRIEGNQIHFLNTTVETVIGIPKLIGIYSNSSDHPRILNNSVDNNFLNDPTATQFINNNNTGIYVHENKNSVLHCNLANFTRFGILATGANGNSTNYDQTAGNFMNNSHANMLLLKLQVEGSLGQIGKEISNFPLMTFDANNTFSPNLQFGPLNNVYRVTDCPQSNTSDEIVTAVNRLTQAQSSASNTNTNDCVITVNNPTSITSGFLCGDENPWPDLDLQYAMLVAAENTNYIDFEDGARQSDQEWVYRWVEENPDLRVQFPILDSFYLYRYSGVTGQLNRIDEAMALLGDSALRAQPTLWLQAHGNIVTQNNALDVNASFGQYAQQMNTLLLRDMLPDAPEFSENERDAITLWL